MSENTELKPTDTAKLLEWLEDRINANEDCINEYAEAKDWSSAEYHEIENAIKRNLLTMIQSGAFALDEPPVEQVGRQIAKPSRVVKLDDLMLELTNANDMGLTIVEIMESVEELAVNGLIEAEAPSEPAPLQVLAEIWDKWRDELQAKSMTSIHHDGSEMVRVVQSTEHTFNARHEIAIQLALAVHMEIDGTVGCNSNSHWSLGYCVSSMELDFFVLNKCSPTYLQYATEEDAQRACELLQCVAKELFFVFEDATPKQGNEVDELYASISSSTRI